MSILISVLSEFNDKGIKKAEISLKELAKTHLTTTAAVGTLIAAGTKAVEAFNKDAKSQQMLALTLRNTTNATDAQIKSNEDFLSQMSMQVAVADDELRPALSSLLRVTQDQAVAQKLLNDALNLAAISQRPVTDTALALGKAYQGNFKALKSMGLGISDAALKSKYFEQVMMVIRPVIEDAATQAANSADGGLKKMKIAVDELAESIGSKLSPVVSDFATIATDLTTKTNNSGSVFSKFAGAMGYVAKSVLPVIGVIKSAAQLTALWAKSIRDAGKATLDSAGDFRKFDQMMTAKYNASLNKVNDSTKTLTTSTTKLKTAAQLAAEALLKSTKDALENAKESLREYASSLKDTVNGFLSLSSAVADANQTESTYTDAVKERLAAYAALNALQAKGLYTTEEMAAATDRVAKAELNLSDAQSKRTSYSAEFQKQLTAAKTFASQLTTLAPQLSKAALAQLISLGPVAGSAVAADLIAGTGALTVGSLNADLAALDVAGAGLGDTAIAGDMGLLNQASVGKTGNNVYITVTSADPNAVVDALKRYMKTNGNVPIKVSG